METNVIYSVFAERSGVVRSEGIMRLVRISDTIYTMEYTDENDESNSLFVDMDMANFNLEEKSIEFIEPFDNISLASFHFNNKSDLASLENARKECQAVCDLRLRIDSVLRDVYYAGLYSELHSSDKVIISDELDKLQKSHVDIFSEFEGDSTIPDTSTRETSPTKKRVDVNKISCVFCNVSRQVQRDVAFAVHPYVPFTFEEKSIYMCLFCLENWKEYREFAESEEQLILTDEINEELCAICSDTPETLIMCSYCPRSYCSGCLSKVMMPSDYEDLSSSEETEWTCMCCFHGFLQNPTLTRDHWTIIGRKPKQGKVSGLLRKRDTDGAVGSESTIYQDKLSMMEEAMSVSSTGLDIGTEKKGLQGSENKGKSLKADKGTAGKSEKEEVAVEVSQTPMEKKGKSGRIITPSHKLIDPDQLTAKEMAWLGKKRSRGETDKEKPKTMGNKRKKVESGKGEIQQVHQVLDEFYYFHQYFRYYEDLVGCLKAKNKNSPVHSEDLAGIDSTQENRFFTSDHDIITDDVCFLCKDGGDLLECDWTIKPSDSPVKHSSSSAKPTAQKPKKSGCLKINRCLKVYHEYCLDFKVTDEDWCCPRHFCDVCGSKELKYICKYCPISICENCPEDLVKKYGYVRYSELDDPETGEFDTLAGQVPIACQSCLVIFEKLLERVEGGPGQEKDRVALIKRILKHEKRFPGVPPTEDEMTKNEIFRIGGPHKLKRNRKVQKPAVAPAASLPKKEISEKPDEKRKNPSSWTEEEDKALLAGKLKYGKSGRKILQDPEFASALKKRSVADITFRLAYVDCSVLGNPSVTSTDKPEEIEKIKKTESTEISTVVVDQQVETSSDKPTRAETRGPEEKSMKMDSPKQTRRNERTPMDVEGDSSNKPTKHSNKTKTRSNPTQVNPSLNLATKPSTKQVTGGKMNEPINGKRSSQSPLTKTSATAAGLTASSKDTSTKVTQLNATTREPRKPLSAPPSRPSTKPLEEIPSVKRVPVPTSTKPPTRTSTAIETPAAAAKARSSNALSVSKPTEKPISKRVAQAEPVKNSTKSGDLLSSKDTKASDERIKLVEVGKTPISSKLSNQLNSSSSGKKLVVVPPHIVVKQMSEDKNVRPRGRPRADSTSDKKQPSTLPAGGKPTSSQSQTSPTSKQQESSGCRTTTSSEITTPRPRGRPPLSDKKLTSEAVEEIKGPSPTPRRGRPPLGEKQKTPSSDKGQEKTQEKRKQKGKKGKTESSSGDESAGNADEGEGKNSNDSQGLTPWKRTNNSWTNEEYEALLEAQEVHGNNGVKVLQDPKYSKILGNRTVNAVNSRLQIITRMGVEEFKKSL